MTHDLARKNCDNLENEPVEIEEDSGSETEDEEKPRRGDEQEVKWQYPFHEVMKNSKKVVVINIT